MRIDEGAGAVRRRWSVRSLRPCIAGATAVLGFRTLGTLACGSNSESVDARSDASSIVVYGSPYGDSGCDATKAPKDDPCVLADAYGVFVAPASSGGDDTGDGTMARPFATFGKALSSARSNVFVCNGTYTENVTVTAAVHVYGGLACPIDGGAANWAYSGGAAMVSASSAASPALLVTGAGDSGVTLEDLTFVTPNEPEQGWDPVTGDGTSSIAGFIATSTVTLTRVTLIAGTGSDGAPGAPGATMPNYPLLVDGGANTAPSGTLAGSAPDGAPGAAGGSIACTNGTSSTGGTGGSISESPPSGADGMRGTPASSASQGIQNGAGGSLADPDDPSALDGGCPGNPGADGLPAPGGSAAVVYGSLSGGSWAPSPGGDGQAGGTGQGGGGGSGGAATDFGVPLWYPGSGGAAGGCGGTGGAGGRGGGASIALVSSDSVVMLVNCTLHAGQGGNGGDGGPGQPGQGGGNLTGGTLALENPDTAPCAGGAGGNGAGGSGGAGGTAGLSAGIVYTGTAPSYDPATTILPGLAGSPGQPGTGGAHGANLAGAYGLTTGSDGNAGVPGLGSAPVLVLGL
ncbi:MAG TPA: hypothetical protein VEK07_19605 [Polyangiaceae bacterium]|nr:hypothetical protein [Polyangiaceae bacterium]